MKIKTCLSVALIAAAALPGFGAVSYLKGRKDAVPRGRVVAVEARVAVPEGRVGSERAARWSLSWSGVEISLEFDFRTHLDGVDEPTVLARCNGAVARVSKGFNVSGGYNTLAVECGADGSASIVGGEFALRELMRVDSLPLPVDSVAVTGDRARVELLIVETDDADFARLRTAYSAEQLAEAERWRYLDRENDPASARPGGDYELALVPAAGGAFDIIYMGGAVTNAALWCPGMLKGSLTPTGYQGYYRLSWFDSTGRELPDECFAEIDGAGSTLTLSFPSLQARLRFSKTSGSSGSR